MKKDQYKIIIPQEIRAAFDNKISSDVGLDLRIRQIRKLVDVVDELNTLTENLPERYAWDFLTVEGFALKMQNLNNTQASCLDFNKLYWGDTDQTIRAYMVMCIWRMVDICTSAFKAIEQEGILAAGNYPRPCAGRISLILS